MALRSRYDGSLLRLGEGLGPPRGTKDPVLLVWIEQNGFVLVTDNRESIPVHLAEHLDQGGHVPGILQVPEEYAFGELADEIALVVGASLAGELEDRITHVHVP